MDDWDWDAMEASPLKGTDTATKRPTAIPPPTENHEVEEGSRQDDHSDHELDTLDWDVLKHPPDTDAKTKLDDTSRLPSSLTCEQRQAHWLQCQDKCWCKNSLPNLGGKTRTIQDYGFRIGVVNLISNMHIGQETAVPCTLLGAVCGGLCSVMAVNNWVMSSPTAHTMLRVRVRKEQH